MAWIGKFYGWRTKTWKEEYPSYPERVGEQQRLSSDQGSLRVTSLVCAEVRRARLWRVLSPKNVLVARSFAAPGWRFPPSKETKAGIRVKCNHSPRVSIERNPRHRAIHPAWRKGQLTMLRVDRRGGVSGVTLSSSFQRIPTSRIAIASPAIEFYHQPRTSRTPREKLVSFNRN